MITNAIIHNGAKPLSALDCCWGAAAIIHHSLENHRVRGLAQRVLLVCEISISNTNQFIVFKNVFTTDVNKTLYVINSQATVSNRQQLVP